MLQNATLGSSDRVSLPEPTAPKSQCLAVQILCCVWPYITASWHVLGLIFFTMTSFWVLFSGAVLWAWVCAHNNEYCMQGCNVCLCVSTSGCLWWQRMSLTLPRTPDGIFWTLRPEKRGYKIGLGSQFFLLTRWSTRILPLIQLLISLWCLCFYAHAQTPWQWECKTRQWLDFPSFLHDWRKSILLSQSNLFPEGSVEFPKLLWATGFWRRYW